MRVADKCSLLSISLDFRAVYLLPSFLKLSCSFGIVVIRVHLSDSYLVNIEAIPGFCLFEALVLHRDDCPPSSFTRPSISATAQRLLEWQCEICVIL